MEKKQHSSTSATLWSLLEKLSTQVVSFVIGIALARLLTPYDYGVVGIVSIFIVVSNVFIDSGFANALIRKIDRDEKDLSTAFYFNVIVGFIAYFTLFISAPFIASYFEEPLLVPLVRIVGINVFFNSLCIVQTALLTANLNIRLQTLINVTAQLPSGLIAICLAYYGFGVYALACQTVFASIIKLILLWHFAKWKPKEHFAKDSFKYLWSFGSKLLGATLIGTFFEQIYSVLIGKYIGKDDLGYYTKSAHLRDNVNGVASGIVTKIALPIISRYQNDDKILLDKYREIMKLLTLFVSPISAILFFSADNLIVFLWSTKWLSSAILFKLLIFGAMFQPIGQLSLILMQVVQRTDLILKLEFPKKTVFTILIVGGFYYGVVGLCVAIIFINLIASLINMYATKKFLDYSYFSQLYDVFKYMLISYSITWICSFCVLSNIPIFNIIILSVISTIFYLIFLYLINDELSLKYMCILQKKIMSK